MALHTEYLNFRSEILFFDLPVVLDETVQRVRVRHPRQQPRVGGEWDDREALDGQVAPERLRVVEEERVDEAEELHDALVLPQVLVALEQEHVLAAVAAHDRQLPRPLFRGYHLRRSKTMINKVIG